MVSIQKANVILDINEEDMDRYLSMGYSVIDDNGKVIKKGEPQDLESFKRAYLEAKEKIEMLEAEIAALKKSSVTVEKKQTTRRKVEKSEDE